MSTKQKIAEELDQSQMLSNFKCFFNPIYKDKIKIPKNSPSKFNTLSDFQGIKFKRKNAGLDSFAELEYYLDDKVISICYCTNKENQIQMINYCHVLTQELRKELEHCIKIYFSN